MPSGQEIVETLIRVDRISAELNGADRVICMSKALKDACEAAGVEPRKLVILGNRVSTRRFRPAPQYNYDPVFIRVLFVGRLEPQKNIHGIAQALALLRKQSFKIDLQICGGRQMNGYLRGAMSHLQASEWHHRASVPNRELPSLYQMADMYVGPSLFEGFQIPLIEALACGKPCVTSDQPPANEIISQEVGALVDPSHPESIAQGIMSVKDRLNDPHQSQLLRAACRDRALRNWDYRLISKRESHLYEEVLRSHCSSD
jgi:glycosyltransferase involved in cell wall biosynthesis